MSRRHAGLRVVARECGYFNDPDRQPFKVGEVRRDMGKRRARKALRMAGRRARDRWRMILVARGWYGTKTSE